MTRRPMLMRVFALLLLTGAFAPAAVLGALPLVAPVVGVVLTSLMLVTARAPQPAVEPAPVAERR